MKIVLKGMVAGLIATVVLSALMIAKASMGLLPEMNAIRMLTQMAAARIGTPMDPAVGWIIHFLIGTVLWGGLFSLLADRLPVKSFAAKGVFFSVIAWVLMMVVVMPMAGAGLFALQLGIPAAVATLILHIVFGLVLGICFANFVGRMYKAKTALKRHMPG